MLNNDVCFQIAKQYLDFYQKDFEKENWTSFEEKIESLKEFEALKLVNRSFYRAFHDAKSIHYKNSIRTHMMECINELASYFQEKYSSSVDKLELFKEKVTSILEKKYYIERNIGIDLGGIQKNSGDDAVRVALEAFSSHVNKYPVNTIEFKNEIMNDMSAQALMKCKNLSHLKDLILPADISLETFNTLGNFLYDSLKENKELNSINFLYAKDLTLSFQKIDNFIFNENEDSIRFSGIKSLIKLAQENPSLKVLSLQDLDSDSINYLFRVLNDYPVDLDRLDLSHGWISSLEGNALLCAIIRNQDISIREINLSCSDIIMSETEVKQLASALQVNTSIRKLDLTGWDISKTGEEHLRNAMKINSNIEILGIAQSVPRGIDTV